jgi:hypothetical protein
MELSFVFGLLCPLSFLTNYTGRMEVLFFCHSEPPKAAKNLAFLVAQETLRLQLKVTKNP